MFVKYEDMQQDLSKVIARVADFLDIPLHPTLLDAVLKQSSFASMKANMSWISAKHLRKGIKGDWRNHFTVEQNALFDARCREKWEGTGLDSEFMRHLVL